jgi:hypothetical protein
MAWVLEESKSHLAARLVLLSIANHANHQGEQAWPSVPKIAQEAHVSERQVQRAIRELCRIGELIVYLKAGFSQANMYRIVMGGDNLSPPLVTNRTDGGDKSGGVIRKNRPEPSKANPPTPLKKGGKCAKHPDANLTNKGNCWDCYAEKYSSETPRAQEAAQ